MNNEKIIDRIKKLLAMATHDRGNHYECEVAMKMAHRLMAEHNSLQAGFEKGKEFEINSALQ